MKELHDLGVSFDEAFANFEETIRDAKRQWVAKLLQDYPHKEDLEEVAEALRQDLRAEGVEVNSITQSQQTTVTKAPGGDVARVPVKDSLCVITVGLGEPAMVSDIAVDEFTQGHAAQGAWGSWASVPIMIEGCDAGTVCALEGNARAWGPGDQELLQKAAELISAQVEHWARIR